MVEKFVPEEHLLNPSEGETIIAEDVSFENFLKYFGEKPTEWLMGKVISIVGNNTQHNDILMFLVSLLHLYLGFKPIGRLMLAGSPMKISKDCPAREPDLMFVANEHVSRIKTNHLDGQADLAIEIVSPESFERDRSKKFLEYESAGVKEFWLIYELGEDGQYHPHQSDAEGRMTSGVLPGFALEPSLLWQDPLPNSPDLIELARKMASK